jgi:hypothetical protein
MPNRQKCDCLNYCGDDPRIERGSVSPCEAYVKQEQLTKKRQDLYRHFAVTNDQDLIAVMAAKLGVG